MCSNSKIPWRLPPYNSSFSPFVALKVQVEPPLHQSMAARNLLPPPAVLTSVRTPQIRAASLPPLPQERMILPYHAILHYQMYRHVSKHTHTMSVVYLFRFSIHYSLSRCRSGISTSSSVLAARAWIGKCLVISAWFMRSSRSSPGGPTACTSNSTDWQAWFESGY